jgi:hypothetical protein
MALRARHGLRCAYLATILACGDGSTANDRCLTVDLVRITARADTIGVGDTVTYRAELLPSDCLPGDITTEDWRWESFDTLVARIDSLSGVAEGVAAGEVLIQAAHALNPGVESRAILRVVGSAAGQLRSGP